MSSTPTIHEKRSPHPDPYEQPTASNASQIKPSQAEVFTFSEKSVAELRI